MTNELSRETVSIYIFEPNEGIRELYIDILDSHKFRVLFVESYGDLIRASRTLPKPGIVCELQDSEKCRQFVSEYAQSEETPLCTVFTSIFDTRLTWPELGLVKNSICLFKPFDIFSLGEFFLNRAEEVQSQDKL